MKFGCVGGRYVYFMTANKGLGDKMIAGQPSPDFEDNISNLGPPLVT
jgi:hypothetical protein